MKQNLYAVIVGVGKVKEQELVLKYAKADTKLFGKTLEGNARGLFSKVNIIYLNEDTQTTKDAILKELNGLQNISKNDLFVFYATSFAKVIDANYYMITSNTRSMNNEDIVKDAISRDELIEAFEKIPAKNKLLLFDTCYPSVAIDLRYKLKEKPNIVSISASNSKDTAIKISVNKHGIFANVVSDGIAGEADLDSDGVVNSSELVKYVFNAASVEAARFDYSQTPAYYQGGKSFNITSSKNVEPMVISTTPKAVKIEKIKPKIAEKKPQVVKVKKVEPRKIEIKPKVVKSKELKVENKKQKISIDRFNFTIDNSSIFVDIKRKIKKHFRFTNDKGENLIVFEFYTNRFMKHYVKKIDSDKISQIKIGYHGDSFRVAIYMKTKTSYNYKVTKNGFLIKLK